MEEKEALIVQFFEERPWIYRQGQTYRCWIRSNPSSYKFMEENDIEEKLFESVYNRIVPEKYKEIFKNAKTVISYQV